MAIVTDYGIDISTDPDLDPAFAPIRGRQVLAQVLARRLQTVRGSLPFNPYDGLDLNDWLHEAATAPSLYQLRSAIQAECEKDERVYAVEVQLNASPTSSKALHLQLSVEPVEGMPFSMTAELTAFNFTLLNIE